MFARAPLEDWPAPDRAMWANLIARGSPLDESGALAHLRASSVETFGECYGFWLGWLHKRESEALAEDPVARATAARVRCWVAEMSALSPTTRVIRAGHLLRILTAHAPEADWSAHRRIVSLIRRQASETPKSRKAGRIVSSVDLYEAGIGLMMRDGNTEGAPASLAEAKRRRDGMMVVFLALLPIRRRAFCSLDIGGALVLRDGSIAIHLEGARTKSGAPWEAPLPQLLVEPLTHYLTHVRPWLMARSGARHASLWVNDKGRPYYEPHLATRIPWITDRLLGTKVSIHLFRDAAATTLAHHSPDAARLTRAILGHSSFRMAEKHYNHARTIDAGRRYSALIEDLKESF